MTRQERFVKIVAQHNKWIAKYKQTIGQGDWEAASYYAFMSNAVLVSISDATDPELREYFYQNT